MAKREIQRQVEEPAPVATTGQAEEQNGALPAEKQARPKEVKPLDVTVEVKAPGVFVMRVWNGLILYPNKFRMDKVPIVAGKPVKIRITQ